MNNIDTFKSLVAVAQSCAEALKPLNQQMLSLFSSSAVTDTLKSLSTEISASVPRSLFSQSVQQEIRSISQSYSQLVRAYEIGRSLSDAIKTIIPDLQIDTMFQLSQSIQTDLIRDLSGCFANAQYEGIVEVLNQSMARPCIDAPDVSFIKTSKLVQTIKNELAFPKGFASSLHALNQDTAKNIANDEIIKYDTVKNRFVSEEGETDSKGLNVISSGKQILTFSSGELFTEAELIDFMSLLSSTPMLALSDKTGQRIYEFLKELFQSRDRSIGFDKDIYYHCRSHKLNTMPFTYDQMLKAPNGLPWAGRYNQVGRSNYYFSDSRSGAETEIKKHKTNDDVLQTVILHPKKPITLLDLSGTLQRGATFLRYIRFSLSDVTDKMPREYLIPCFVSDCCKALGFDGIKYYGAKEYSNYVTWNDGYFTFGGMCE